MLDWAEKPLAKTGKPRSVRDLRAEAERRRDEYHFRKVKGATNRCPAAVVPLILGGGPQREAAEPSDATELAAIPRQASDVVQRLGKGEVVPFPAPAGIDDLVARNRAKNGIIAALEMEALSSGLRATLQHCLGLLSSE